MPVSSSLYNTISGPVLVWSDLELAHLNQIPIEYKLPTASRCVLERELCNKCKMFPCNVNIDISGGLKNNRRFTP